MDREIEDLLDAEGQDINFALAKLRMEMERKLRQILRRRTETEDPLRMRGRFLSARSLFREFARKYPKYERLYKSFDFVLKICNAAIHGQEISPGLAHEALYMGLRILDELKGVDDT